jgi:long-chain acyl-CoA synthetase
LGDDDMIDTNFLLYDLVSQGIEKNNRFVCTEKKDKQWHSIESQGFLDKVQAFTLSLHQLGIKKSDKVALHSENRTDWLIADLAITALGGVTVPIYTTQSPEQIDYILTHSEAKGLIVSTQKVADTYQDIQAAKNLRVKIALDIVTQPDFQSYASLLEVGNILLKTKPTLFQHLKSAVSPNDLVTIAYTSGTTGTPKGVMLNHRNLAHAIQVPLRKTFLFENFMPEQDTVLSYLPFTHVFEHCAIYGYLAISVPVYIVGNLDNLQAILAEAKPVHFTTVPRLLEKIYQNIVVKVNAQKGITGFLARQAFKKIPTYKLNRRQSLIYRLYDRVIFKKIRQKLGGNIRGITSGGAALSSDIMMFFNAIGIPVAQGYGLTETSPGLTLYDVKHLKLHTAGKAFEGVDLKIAEDGEIIAKGDNIMQGYFKDPEKTAEVINADGWFHTGDIGHIDADGFLFITDRKKELFKLSTGKYIAPAPIENKLITIEGVDQALIVGENEKFCGALIVPSDGYCHKQLALNIEKALLGINQELSPWETIKKFVISADPMTIESGELTPTMKKKRRIILQNRKQDIDSMYY